MSRKNLLLTYSLAVGVRYLFLHSDFQKDIVNRIEIQTPLNSFKRVVEGRYRMSLGIDPYESDSLHVPPLHLTFYTFLIDNFPNYLPYIFMLIDLLTGHCLYTFARRYMLKLYIKQEKNKHTYAEDALSQLLEGRDLYLPPQYALVVFLFNPYTIFNSAAMTTTTVNNLLLSLFFVGIIYDNLVISLAAMTLSTLQSFYPVIMIAPLYLTVYKRKESHLQACLTLFIYALSVIGIIYISGIIYNGYQFLDQTYGFILKVPDQQPNVGVFWYFFMEMFEHFRLLFLFSYQMNVTVLYFLPLTFKFREDPPLLAACFVTLIAIFKSYPSIGDFALSLALLPCWKHLYSCMQQVFISSVTIVITTALAPILWDLWIFWGTANANFFFGATLAFVTAHIFLVTDISFAYTKREYLLKYGNCRQINGKDAKLVLE